MAGTYRASLSVLLLESSLPAYWRGGYFVEMSFP